jgi:DNA-3-methyladenine glycosylase II
MSMRLDDITFQEAIDSLRQADADLDAIYLRFGPPPLWAREPGFPTLVRIILEQQVSLASAAAAFGRLEARISTVTPAGLLGLSEAEFKDCGFSRQKAGYARGIAQDILDGRLDLDALAGMDDDEALETLVKVRGIGPWSADIYLLMALGRADIWPRGDLALARSLQRIKHLASLPAIDEMKKISRMWKPWRAVAARFLWHDYLSRNPGG